MNISKQSPIQAILTANNFAPTKHRGVYAHPSGYTIIHIPHTKLLKLFTPRNSTRSENLRDYSLRQFMNLVEAINEANTTITKRKGVTNENLH